MHITSTSGSTLNLQGTTAPLRMGLNVFLIPACCVFLLLLCCSQGKAQSEFGQTASPETSSADVGLLAEYLAEAAANNQELQAAFNRWQAALAEIPQASALPDPRLTLNGYIQPVETRTGPQRAGIGVSQSFPWPGTLALKGDRAAQQAAVRKALLDAKKLDIFYALKQIYYEYAYVTQAVSITSEIVELVRYLEGVARARYSAGASPHADVIRTQVELGRLEDRLNSVRDLKNPIRARLNALLNRPVDQHLPDPPRVPIMRLCLTKDELRNSLATSNPRLLALEFAAAGEQAGIELARKDFYPDLTFGLQTIITGDARSPGVTNADENPVIASLSMNLPLWQKPREAALSEARSKLSAVRHDKASLEKRLGSDLEQALYQYADAERKIDLYRQRLIPKAKQSLGVSLEAFQSGKASSLELMDAEKTLLELKLALLRSLATQAQRLAEMETLVGYEIPCKIEEVPDKNLNLDVQALPNPDEN